MAGRWEREYYQPEEGDAVLSFVVLGDLPPELSADPKAYRSSGPPKGMTVERFDRADGNAWFEELLEGYAGALLAEDPDLESVVKDAPKAALLAGAIDDPETLDYLRDAVGTVTAYLDAGGVAVFDAIALRWWSPAEWRETIFDPAGPEPVEHISLLASEEDDGFWLHSRGLEKFGRPDLSARALAQDDLETYAGLFESLVVMLAGGATIPDGQRLRIAGTKTELTATLVEDTDGAVFYEFAS